MADIRITRPAAGNQSIAGQTDARYIFDFAASDGTFSKNGENLQISFEDGSTVTIENFYQAHNAENQPVFELEGEEITAEAFFAALNQPDLAPAAGASASAAARNARFHQFGNSELNDGLDHLSGLDWGMEAPAQIEDTSLVSAGFPDDSANGAAVGAPGGNGANDGETPVTVGAPLIIVGDAVMVDESSLRGDAAAFSLLDESVQAWVGETVRNFHTSHGAGGSGSVEFDLNGNTSAEITFGDCRVSIEDGAAEWLSYSDFEVNGVKIDNINIAQVEGAPGKWQLTWDYELLGTQGHNQQPAGDSNFENGWWSGEFDKAANEIPISVQTEGWDAVNSAVPVEVHDDRPELWIRLDDKTSIWEPNLKGGLILDYGADYGAQDKGESVDGPQLAPMMRASALASSPADAADGVEDADDGAETDKGLSGRLFVNLNNKSWADGEHWHEVIFDDAGNASVAGGYIQVAFSKTAVSSGVDYCGMEFSVVEGSGVGYDRFYFAIIDDDGDQHVVSALVTSQKYYNNLNIGWGYTADLNDWNPGQNLEIDWPVYERFAKPVEVGEIDPQGYGKIMAEGSIRSVYLNRLLPEGYEIDHYELDKDSIGSIQVHPGDFETSYSFTVNPGNELPANGEDYSEVVRVYLKNTDGTMRPEPVDITITIEDSRPVVKGGYGGAVRPGGVYSFGYLSCKMGADDGSGGIEPGVDMGLFMQLNNGEWQKIDTDIAGASFRGAHGTLFVDENGHVTYKADRDAADGESDTFNFKMVDADGSVTFIDSALKYTIDSSAKNTLAAIEDDNVLKAQDHAVVIGTGNEGDIFDNVITVSDKVTTGVTIDGREGNDVITGSAFDDHISGGSGNDWLDGGAGADSLYGGDGNDVIIYDKDDAVIDGGKGFNLLVNGGKYENPLLDSVTSMSVALHGVPKDQLPANIYDIARMYDFSWTDNGDGTYGIVADETKWTSEIENGRVIYKYIGDENIVLETAIEPQAEPEEPVEEVVETPTRNDVFMGGADADKITSGNSKEIISAGGGNDQITGGAGWIISGDSGNDKITVGNIIDGGSGKDTITGNSSPGIIYGGSGDETITGGSGDDTIYGGSGNDTIHAGNGNDVIFGGAGADSIRGQGGNDYIDGQGGADTMNGFGDNDIIVYNKEAKILDGGSGSGDIDILLVKERYGREIYDELKERGKDNTSPIRNFSIFMYSENQDLPTNLEQLEREYHFKIAGGNLYLQEDFWTKVDMDGVICYSYNNDEMIIHKSTDNNSRRGEKPVDFIITDDASRFAASGEDARVEVTTSENGDLLTGTDNDDFLGGNEGHDTLRGGAGNDTLMGGEGNDVLEGGAGADILLGGEGDDVLLGGTGDDTLLGGQGNDFLDGGQGNDYLDGGEGRDIIVYDAKDSAINGGDGLDILLDSGTAPLAGKVGTHIFNMEAALHGISAEELENENFPRSQEGLGELYHFTISEDGKYLILDGGWWEENAEGVYQYKTDPAIYFEDLTPGKSALAWEEGEGPAVNEPVEEPETGKYVPGTSQGDELEGSEYDDLLEGMEGNDRLDGLAGNDTLLGGSGNDTLLGGAGNDILLGGADADSLSGGAGDDRLEGEGGNDTLEGDGGSDSLLGGAGYDVLKGGEGEDFLNGGEDGDKLYGGDGSDVLYGDIRGSGSDLIDGGKGDDFLFGDGGDDTLIGGEGADAIYGGYGNDLIVYDPEDKLINGGQGVDFLIVKSADAAAYDSATNIHGVEMVLKFTDGHDPADAQVATAGFLANLGITGSGLNISLDKNWRHEGETNTYTRLADPADENSEVLAVLEISDKFTATVDSKTSVTSLEMAANGNNTYPEGEGGVVVSPTYSSGSFISGNLVNLSNIDNMFYGTPDNDWIQIQQHGATIGGSDTIYGGAGDDYIDGGDGADELHGGDGNDTLYGGFEDTIAGHDGASDTLYGDAGNDMLYGYYGDDVLDGGSGNDTLYGGIGSDSLMGGDGNDLIYGDNNDPRTTAVYDQTYNDTIRGGEGSDTIYGELGDDYIDGEAGADEIYGGEGNDFIVFDKGDLLIDGGSGFDVLIAKDDGSLPSLLDMIVNGKNGGGDGTIPQARNIELMLKFENGAPEDIKSLDALAEKLGLIIDRDSDGVTTITMSPIWTAAGSSISEGSKTSSWTCDIEGIGKIELETTYESRVMLYDNRNLVRENGDAAADMAGDDVIDASDAIRSANGGSGLDFLISSSPDASLKDAANIEALLKPVSDEYQGDLPKNMADVQNLGIRIVKSGSGSNIVLDGAVWQAQYDELTGELTGWINNTGELRFETNLEPNLVKFGGAGEDELEGGRGDDKLYGGEGDDTLEGLDGNDTLYGGGGDDLLDGGADNDVLYGQGGDDILKGGAGNDRLDGGEGNDTLYGEAGNDTLAGGYGNDVLYGDADTIKTAESDVSYNDVLSGGSGDDTLYGGIGNDTLNGDAGDDYLDGGAGQDKIYGGSGNDFIKFDASDTLIDGGEGIDFLIAQNQGARLKDLLEKGTVGNVEVMLKGFGDNDLPHNVADLEKYGITYDNGKITLDRTWELREAETVYIVAFSSVYGITMEANFLMAADGTDGGQITLVPPAGSGFDIPSVDNSSDYEGGPGSEIISGTDGNDTLYGGGGADTIRGNDGDDELYGYYRGNETVPGNDVLDGGSGNDSLYGGAGNDTLYGGAGKDQLYGGTGNDSLAGEDGDDVLYGGDGNDQLYGGDGRDYLEGGIGDDTLHGGADDDTLDGGAGNDLLYGEDGNDLLLAGDGDDLLFGGKGEDTLEAGAGNDYLNGGAGIDELHGGAGNDLMVYDAVDTLIDGGFGIDFLISHDASVSLGDMLLSGQASSVEFLLKGLPEGAIDKYSSLDALGKSFGFSIESKDDGSARILLSGNKWEALEKVDNVDDNGNHQTTTVWQFHNGDSANRDVTLETTAECSQLTTESGLHEYVLQIQAETGNG